MSGNTVTFTIAETADGVEGAEAPGASTGAASRSPSLAPSRAARELDLKRSEFDLAVQLGYVRTIPGGDGGGGGGVGVGGRRVTRAEIDRIRSERGFPEELRARVAVVGTRDGAALMDVTPGRFTRFARLGLVVPVKWHLNRYRAVVWLYLAEEVRQFAAGRENARLLTGRTPEGLRDQLDAGLDLRPRNWRGRNLGFQLRQTEDPWAKAAVLASLLDPTQVAEIVRDPYERAQLTRLRPALPVHGEPDSPAARIAVRITTAEDLDEIGWLRADLREALIEARHHRSAPRPSPRVPVERPPEQESIRWTTRAPETVTRSGTGDGHRSEALTTTAVTRQARHVPKDPVRPGGMFGWLRRGNA